MAFPVSSWFRSELENSLDMGHYSPSPAVAWRIKTEQGGEVFSLGTERGCGEGDWGRSDRIDAFRLRARLACMWVVPRFLLAPDLPYRLYYASSPLSTGP